MHDGDASNDELADETAWKGIPDDDELWAGPVHQPPPLADPTPPLLNTHEMDWESFERLILAMARRVDGAYDVRRFGRPGQAQHGLDVVGFFAERRPSVYQAKRWQEFNESALRAAVERYAEGRRAFDAERIVVAVATEARDAKTLEVLDELRDNYSELRIELWDRQAISERLRTEPHVVTQFFGAPTAAAFCTTTATPAAPQPAPSIEVDAVLRGPIANLRLGDDLRRAEAAMGERPGEAAELLGGIADRLKSSGFVPHAAPVRELQARALRAADRRADEAWIRLDVGWGWLDAGETFFAGRQVTEIAGWGDDSPDDVVRCANALSASVAARRDYGYPLEDLAEAFDELRPGDPHRADAALVLAEAAVAARIPELVSAREDGIREIAAALPSEKAGELIAGRLLMCVAEATDGWEEFARLARETYHPRVTALVFARHARHLALVPEPQASIARWRDAIERACVEGLNDDAADWLYSVRAVSVQNGVMPKDVDEPHRHAQALRAAGSGALLREPYRARERGLASLRDQKWPTALEAFQRFLWRSVVTADWSGELDAHELLGDLFVRTGRAADAIRHYIMAGQRKKLGELAAVLTDEPIMLPTDVITSRPWERAAAFSFIAAIADLIPDEEARIWCGITFDEIDRSHEGSMFAPDPWLDAFTAFGQLAVVSTDDQARRFLQVSRDLIPREPNRYRLTDEAQIHALIGVARAHPVLRDEALDQLLAALLLDTRMAELALRHGHDLLRVEGQRTVNAVRRAAAEGNLYAALALVAAEEETAPAVPLARERLEAAIAPRVHEPGVRTFGTILGETAALVTLLPVDDGVRFAHGMLEFANDVEESPQNRHEALMALQGVARTLPDEVRDELFPLLIPFADGRADGPDGEELFPGAADPLSRFRFVLGPASLSPAGLMAAAAIARTPEDHAEIERMAVEMMRGATEETSNAIATALASLPPEQLTLPIRVLAGHPSPWLRALAAVVWAQREDSAAETGLALTRDPSPQVRRSLARSVRDDPAHAEIRAVLIADPRRSVRREVDAPLPP